MVSKSVFAALVATTTVLLCASAARLLPVLQQDLGSIGGDDEAPVLASTHDLGSKKPWMEVLDDDARIFLYHHFLSDDECDSLRDKATKWLERSGVVAPDDGSSEVSEVRTSDGMFFNRAQDDEIEAIERRLAEWTLTPVHAGEGLQVLRYQKDQKYDAHWDYFFDDVNNQNGGNRFATVLMYLEAADEGGQTVFPKIPAPTGVNANFSECAKYHLAVKPKKGDAILFHSMRPTGKLEERSMHGACPVLKGEKWSMTKWIHAEHYVMNDKFDIEVGESKERRMAHNAPKHAMHEHSEEMDKIVEE